MFGQGMFDEPDWGVADESTYDDDPMIVDEFEPPVEVAPPAPQRKPPQRPTMATPQAVPMPVMPAFAPQPMGVVTADTQKGAGVGLLLIALGGGAGAFAGGLYGAAAGVLGMGALRNALRAKKLWSSTVPEDQAEAGMSATTAGFGLLAAGFLIYQSYQKRK